MNSNVPVLYTVPVLRLFNILYTDIHMNTMHFGRKGPSLYLFNTHYGRTFVWSFYSRFIHSLLLYLNSEHGGWDFSDLVMQWFYIRWSGVIHRSRSPKAVRWVWGQGSVQGTCAVLPVICHYEACFVECLVMSEQVCAIAYQDIMYNCVLSYT